MYYKDRLGIPNALDFGNIEYERRRILTTQPKLSHVIRSGNTGAGVVAQIQ